MKNKQSIACLRSCLWALALLCCTSLSACKNNGATEAVANSNPEWLDALIAKQLAEKPANPSAKIYGYTYLGQQVYYLTSRCCDIPGRVYNSEGEVICEPDGGITGKGDGRCTDFFDARQNEVLIWEDKRQD